MVFLSNIYSVLYNNADISLVMSNKRIKLAEFATANGIAYLTAYRHWQKGNIKGIQLPTGTILVEGWVEGNENTTHNLNAIIYTRVTNTASKQKLKEQVTSLTNFAQERGYNVMEVVEEIAPSFSDHRTKLVSVLYRTDWDILIIEDKATFMKFAFPYVEALLRRNGQEVLALRDYKKDTSDSLEELDSLISGAGDQELISLFTKVRGVMKTLIGIGGAKASIEESINTFLK